MRRPSVLLPHPLSPTRPNVSPRRTRIETPSTARTTSARPREEPAPHGEILRQLVGRDERPTALAAPAACSGETRLSLRSSPPPRPRASSATRARSRRRAESSSGSSLAHLSIIIGQRSGSGSPGGGARGRGPSLRSPGGGPVLRLPPGPGGSTRLSPRLRHALEQPERVGVPGAREEVVHGGALDDASRVHDETWSRVLGDEARGRG